MITSLREPAATGRTILQILHGYNAPFGALGALYARTLTEQGWQVTTLYLTGTENNRVRDMACSQQVIFLNLSAVDMKGLKLRQAWQLRQRLQQLAPALIIAHRYKSLYLALLASTRLATPVIGVAHAFNVLKPVMRPVFLRCFSRRLTLVGVSQAVTDDLQQNSPSLTCMPLPNGIDTETLQNTLLAREDARKTLGIATNHFVFGNVGRLHDDKDQSTLIHAFSRIAASQPQARLWLIGQGKQHDRYRRLIDSLGIAAQTVLAGAVPDAASYFPAFDVYVSASDKEPFGIVLTEAMLARLPVISTNCGGAPEVLGAHALYFSRGDVAALATHMQTLCGSTQNERKAIGDALYDRLCQQFGLTAFSQRLKKLLQTVLHADADQRHE